MLLHHLLHAPVAPILVLLEVAHHAQPGDAGEPGGADGLDGAAHQGRRQVQGQGAAQQADAALHQPQTGQAAPHREGQFLGVLPAELDAMHLADFQHHLGIHRRRAEQIHTG